MDDGWWMVGQLMRTRQDEIRDLFRRTYLEPPAAKPARPALLQRAKRSIGRLWSAVSRPRSTQRAGGAGTACPTALEPVACC
jgi:hypothetical protein